MATVLWRDDVRPPIGGGEAAKTVLVAPTALNIGHGAPAFTNGWARGVPWVEEQQTRNWPNCADHHKSAHQND